MSVFAALVLCIAVPPNALAHEVEDDGPRIATRSYVDGPFGQVHVQVLDAQTPSGKPPLMLFHLTPYASGYYARFMDEMAQDRVVIAMDMPGFGASDAPPEPQTMEALATAAAAVVEGLGYGENGDGLIDVLGFHTGCLLAAELAIQRPDLVRKVVLPGMPFYTPEGRAQRLERYAKPKPIEADGSHLQDMWQTASATVKHGISLERAHRLFAMQAQCYPNCWWSYWGVFTYESEVRLPLLQQPTLLIAVDGSLKEETQAAQAVIPNSDFVYIEQIKSSGFELYPELYAGAIRPFLDED